MICRRSAARLLANLVTDNAWTANVMATSIPMSPQAHDLTSRIRHAVGASTEYTYSRPNNNTGTSCSWLDMLLAAAQRHQQ